MNILGPFETGWHYKFLLITNNSLKLVKASFWLVLKYQLNLQSGFFPNAVDKTKNRILLNNKSGQNFIDFAEIEKVTLYENKLWKNYLKLNFTEEEVKLNILERSQTDFYKNILKLYLGNKFKIEP